MGIFNRAIPNIQTNNLNQVRVTQPEQYYVDDIFDPLFNAKVKEQLTLKYGNPFLGVVGGYMEGIDNALIGQKDQWGILGPGMGILSGFGRSMDKAGDFIIGGVTEGVKGLTGQGFENPLHNIFVEDEDYSGQRLLAAMGNSMAGLAKAPKLEESDFNGLWNIPAMGLELATDPGILGGGIKKAANINLSKQVANQTANENLAKMGQLLMDYDDFMAKVSMDMTAPGLRLGAKTLLNKIQQALGNSSAKAWADVALDENLPVEVRAEAASKIQNDSQVQQLMQMADETQSAANNIQTAMNVTSAVGAAFDNSEDVDDLLDYMYIDHIKRAQRVVSPEYLNTIAASKTSTDDLIAKLHTQLDADDIAFGEAEQQVFERLMNRPDINTNLDLRVSDIDARSLVDDYSKIYTAANEVRRMDKDALSNAGINPEYASLELFDGHVPPEAVEAYLNNITPDTDGAYWNVIKEAYGIDYADVQDFVDNALYTGQFYNLTDNVATQNAVETMAGLDPKARKVKVLETPLTLSPSDFAGRSEESYRLGVRAAYNVLAGAFEKAGVPLTDLKSVKDLNSLVNSPVFKRSFPNAKVRESVLDNLRKILFPEEKATARSFMKAVDELTRTVIDSAAVHDTSAATFVGEVLRIAESTGKDPIDLINTVRKNTDIVSWAHKRQSNLKGVERSDFIDDLKILNEVFNLEKSTKSQKTLEHAVSLLKQKEAGAEVFTPYEKGILTRINSLNLHSTDNIARALKAAQSYHEGWENIANRYAMSVNSPERALVNSFVEASEKVQSEILAPIARRYGIAYDQNPLPYFDQDYRKHSVQRASRSTLKKQKSYGDVSKEFAGESKQYTGGRRRISSTSGSMATHYHTAFTNFFRINAARLDDPEYFDYFVDEVFPTLSKHYQVQLNPEYFSKTDMPLHEALSKKMPYRTRAIAQRATDILEEFYTLFDDDIAYILSQGYSPYTKPWLLDKAKNPKLYEAVTRVRTNLGMMPTYSPSDVPKNFKAYKYILDNIFKITNTAPKGKYNFKIVDYFKHNAFDKPVKLELSEIPVKELSLNDGIRIVNASFAADYLPDVPVTSAKISTAHQLYNTTVNDVPVSKKVYKSAYAERVEDAALSSIQNAPAKEAAEAIVDFPSYTDSVKAGLEENLGIPPSEPSNMPSGGENPSSGPVKDADDILTPKKFKSLKDLINEAVTRTSRVHSKKDATLRTKYVEKILESADALMGKGTSLDDIAKYKRAQVYLGGAAVRKEEFLDTLASSGTFLMAYKPTEDFTKTFDVIRQNVSEVNVAMKANVLKPIQFKLPNGNTVIGAMWDTSNRKVLNDVAKGYKNVDVSKLKDIVRLEKGTVNSSMEAYMRSAQYREIDELFNNTRQQEAEFAKLLGFKYDDVYHVKNVMRRGDVEVADYLKNVIYKDIPTSDLDDISDKMMELDVFKHLRGAWGSRKFDKRFVGYIEDFETNGLRIFEDDASRIVRGSFADGSFNNAKFQLYIDLFDNDNFRVSTYFKTPEDLEKVLYARTADNKSSGNLANLVLAAPRLDDTGRIIGFTQFDKTTRVGLQNALNNPNTVLLPAHVFSPLDKVLRKDAKMSNKVYAFIHKHLTLPFKFGVLMNPGFLLGNMSDAYLKQATTMANKYGTSVSEELANVSVAIKDVLTLNNQFDDAYRRFLAHVQAEGFTVAPSNQISSLAASDPRIRKMLKDYVNDKLQHGMGRPIIACELSSEERNVVKLWMLLNSPSTGATFDKGLQDLDIIAKAKNNSKYQMPKNAFDRILMGKGEYLADDVSTWGLFANNPLSRAVMDSSESIENTVRAACILNDFRHKGMDAEWFKEYFDSLDELSAAAAAGDFNSAAYKEQIKKNFNVNMSEAINTMHSANFDYERMTNFTDAVGTAVPFPTFFLKNLGYWLEILVNNPQYIDHAITVQESLWGSRDTSKDEFLAEAKGRGAVPISSGQNLSKFFKGIYKPTPLQSMFGAFSLINSPVEDMYYRLHPAIAGGITAASKVEPIKSIAADVIPSDSVKYRPYSTDMYERNVTKDDPNFNALSYAIHRANPMERTVQNAIRLPDKLRNDQAQLSDFLPSVFQPDFSKK